jgi:hypothetical protein
VTEQSVAEVARTAEYIANEPFVTLIENEPVALRLRRQAEDQVHSDSAEPSETTQLAAVVTEKSQPVVIEQPSYRGHEPSEREQKVIVPELQSDVKQIVTTEETPTVEWLTVAPESAEWRPEVSLFSPDEVAAELPTESWETEFLAPEESALAAPEEPEPLFAETLEQAEVVASPVEIFETWLEDTLAAYEVSLETSEEASEALGVLNETAEAPEQQRPIALLKEVAANLAELPEAEKDALLPIFHEVLAVAQYVRALETEEAAPIGQEQAVQRLIDLCCRLLDTLQIEYAEKDVQDLAALLVAEAERLSAPATTDEVDVRDDVGTRERKHIKRQAWDFGTVGHALHKVLGMTALSNPAVNLFTTIS